MNNDDYYSVSPSLPPNNSTIKNFNKEGAV